MTYPGNFLRLVAGGTLYGVEDWSWSLSIVPNFEGAAAAPAEVPQAIIDAVTTFHGAAGMVHNQARLTYIKLNEIGPNGRYVSQTDTVRHDFVTPVQGGSQGSTVIPQAALAVTLRTSARRGLASSGRFYVPLPAFAIATDGRITSTSSQAAADAALAMVNAINTASDYGDVGVASNVGTGKFRPCQYVEVGRVIDTMRSRREKFVEEYSRSGETNAAVP